MVLLLLLGEEEPLMPDASALCPGFFSKFLVHSTQDWKLRLRGAPEAFEPEFIEGAADAVVHGVREALREGAAAGVVAAGEDACAGKQGVGGPCSHGPSRPKRSRRERGWKGGGAHGEDQSEGA